MRKLIAAFFIFILCAVYYAPFSAAQELTVQKAFKDFAYARDNYQSSLTAFNLKKDSYLKNQTLSLKEEARIALYDFLLKRNDYKRTYLTVIRTRVSELTGLTKDEKETVFTKIDPEVVWLENRKNELKQTDSLEDLINKSQAEDSKYQTDTLPIVYFSLSYVSLSSVIEIKNSHLELYNRLKNEANELVKLGRADASLFDRWFKDIEAELVKINNQENAARSEIAKIFNQDNYQIKKSYERVAEKLVPAKENLLTLNSFISELETTIEEKR